MFATGMAYLEYASNNKLATAILSALLVGIFSWLVKIYRNYRDGKLIYTFLKQSNLNTSFTFRSTEAISSATKIPEKRVEELCIHHPKIKRNEREKQSWQLTE